MNGTHTSKKRHAGTPHLYLSDVMGFVYSMDGPFHYIDGLEALCVRLNNARNTIEAK